MAQHFKIAGGPMEQVGDMLHGNRNVVTKALGMGAAVVGSAVLNRIRSASCPPDPVSAPIESDGDAASSMSVDSLGVASLAGMAATCLAGPLVGAMANAAIGYVAGKPAQSKAADNQEKLTKSLTQAVQDSIQKAGQCAANTVSINSYIGAYEGARDAIRDAMLAQTKPKQARPASSPASSRSSASAELVALRGQGKVVAMAVQEFLSHPSPGSLKHLVKLMHDSYSQHPWYKSFQQKLGKGELAGEWLYDSLLRKTTTPEEMNRMLQIFEAKSSGSLRKFALSDAQLGASLGHQPLQRVGPHLPIEDSATSGDSGRQILPVWFGPQTSERGATQPALLMVADAPVPSGGDEATDNEPMLEDDDDEPESEVKPYKPREYKEDDRSDIEQLRDEVIEMRMLDEKREYQARLFCERAYQACMGMRQNEFRLVHQNEELGKELRTTKRNLADTEEELAETKQELADAQQALASFSSDRKAKKAKKVKKEKKEKKEKKQKKERSESSDE